jgi:hypothetical protein
MEALLKVHTPLLIETTSHILLIRNVDIAQKNKIIALVALAIRLPFELRGPGL